MQASEITKEQAIALLNSGFWEPMSFRERAMFQMFQKLLCMPFSVFHEAVEKTLDRPAVQMRIVYFVCARTTPPRSGLESVQSSGW